MRELWRRVLAHVVAWVTNGISIARGHLAVIVGPSRQLACLFLVAVEWILRALLGEEAAAVDGVGRSREGACKVD